MKRKTITAIVLWTIGLTVIYLSIALRRNEAREIEKHHFDIVARVVHVGHKVIKVVYTIDSTEYISTKSKPYGDILAGDEFYGMANTADRSSILVYYDKPIVDTLNHQFVTVPAMTLDIPSIESDHVKFCYSVNATKKCRVQEVDDNRKMSKDVSDYIVKYRVGDPDIAYLVYSKSNRTP